MDQGFVLEAGDVVDLRRDLPIAGRFRDGRGHDKVRAGASAGQTGENDDEKTRQGPTHHAPLTQIRNLCAMGAMPSGQR